MSQHSAHLFICEGLMTSPKCIVFLSLISTCVCLFILHCGVSELASTAVVAGSGPGRKAFLASGGGMEDGVLGWCRSKVRL